MRIEHYGFQVVLCQSRLNTPLNSNLHTSYELTPITPNTWEKFSAVVFKSNGIRVGGMYVDRHPTEWNGVRCSLIKYWVGIPNYPSIVYIGRSPLPPYQLCDGKITQQEVDYTETFCNQLFKAVEKQKVTPGDEHDHLLAACHAYVDNKCK